MGDAMHFETDVALYERARPAYPEALWARLNELGVLQAGNRAVDLGAGTGLATGPLLAAGLEVTAIEPGPRLAARLSEKYPTATVQVTRAEEAVLADDSFELVLAATSIHWMNLDIVLPKAHKALVRTGRLLVWRNAFGDPAFRTPFRERIDAIVARRDRPPRPGPGELDTEQWVQRLTSGGLFEVESVENFRWSIDLDGVRVRDLFTTFSDWEPREADEAAVAVRDLGGTVTEHYQTPLIVLAAIT